MCVFPGEPCHLAPTAIIFKDITVRGFWLAKWFETATMEQRQAAFGQIGGDFGLRHPGETQAAQQRLLRIILRATPRRCLLLQLVLHRVPQALVNDCLVLAGVDYETAIYRGISTYPRIAAGTVSGNMDRLSPVDLIEAATPIAAISRPLAS